MTKITLALEWFLNPDHLPMIVGLEKNKYKEAGIDLEIIVPSEHYDGFEHLSSQKIDIHCNEPIHLFEHYFDKIKSLGCFFETDGGVMFRKSSIEKLRNNEKIKITTPAANEITNKIGFEILKRYAKKEGFKLDFENVQFVQTDFWHVQNMIKDESFDAAWLCFYNFEGIEAQHEGFEHLFIDQNISPYPNFSALEFISSEDNINKKEDALKKFIEVTQDMALYCKENIEDAKTCYYNYSKEEKTKLLDKIIEDTIPRLKTTIKADSNKWKELAGFLSELEIVSLKKEQYNSIW